MPSLLAPRYWGTHLLAIALVLAAGWLGVWQWHGWQAKRAAEARDLTTAEPLTLATVIGPDDPFPGDQVGQPVTASGTWLPDETFFVSGREYDDRPGYWVVTPLEVTATGSVLPVVRGWSATPEANAPAPVATITGWLQPSEGTGVIDDDPEDDVLPQLRIADLTHRIDADLYGAYVVANPADGTLLPASLEQLPEAARFTALRNLFYALEWWFFGLFVAFIWFRWAQETRESIDSPSGQTL